MFFIKQELRSLSFEELTEEMNDLLWQQAHRFYNNLNCEWIDIDDVYQEFLVVMWEAIDTYDHHQGHFSTYLIYQIRSRSNEIQRWLYRESRDTSKNSHMEVDQDVLEKMPSNQTSMDTTLSKKEFIEKLNKDERCILQYISGYISFSQLQKQLQLTRSGTYRRISKTKPELQKIWKEIFNESLHV